MNNAWLKQDSGLYSAQISDLPPSPRGCPQCGKTIMKNHMTKVDMDGSGEDVHGWRFTHPCGAKLLIIND